MSSQKNNKLNQQLIKQSQNSNGFYTSRTRDGSELSTALCGKQFCFLYPDKGWGAFSECSGFDLKAKRVITAYDC